MDETIIKIENAALKLKKFMIKPANLEISKGYIVGVQGRKRCGKDHAASYDAWNV